MRARAWVPLAAGAALAAAAACFSERGAGPVVNTAAECRVPVTVIDSMHFLVAIRDFAFHPRSIHVPAGATVTWVNCEPQGVEPHTTTSDGGVWDSPELAPGGRYTRTFGQAGTFPYHCAPHETFMKDDTVFVQ
jgi:plastocyanin